MGQDGYSRWCQILNTVTYPAAPYPMLCSAPDKGNDILMVSVVEPFSIRVLGAQISGRVNMKEHRSMGACGYARA